MWGTKVGTHDLTVTSGGKTVSAKVRIINRAQDAYNISVTPTEVDVEPMALSTVTATVTDYWGNPVAGANLTASASGQVLMAGNLTTQAATTGASGTADFTAIAASEGSGTVAVTPTLGCTAATCPAWAVSYTKPATFASAPVTSAAQLININSSGTRTILIDDFGRDSKDNRRWIFANGVTTGFDEGAILKPWVKFPGGSYTEGNKEILVDAAGDYEWERKTNKKAYVIIKSQDGEIASKRVVIPARNAS